MKVIYQKHPVTPEQKVELRSQGYKIIDAAFAPTGYEHPFAQRDRMEERIKAESEAKSADGIDAEKLASPTANSNVTLGDGLDELDAEQLHALAKERGVSVHHKAGADKVREALRAGLGG
ncbi:hypothetical protein EGT81_12760 [Alcaligenes faecalis]|uniref:hypothetical protein n=1 Tax=Alcaligenes faecalis TaxID=511 RepID=UPI000F66FC6C|nr:hypothetical protein [Alcaligenes faecalis]RSE60395.1 hypothetical protein EGT81_12760 [Alcaligenes faecalis]